MWKIKVFLGQKYEHRFLFLNIQAQVRPIGQTTTIGQTQMRMVTQTVPRPIGQTTITRHTTPARLQAPMAMQQVTTTGHRMINATVAQVRPGTTTIMQTSTNMHQSNPPALQPVSATLTQSGFTPGGAQVRVRIPSILFLFRRSLNMTFIWFNAN